MHSDMNTHLLDRSCRPHRSKTGLLWLVTFLVAGSARSTLFAQDGSVQAKSEDPLAIKLLEMDLIAASKIFTRHDLDDDGKLSKSECERLQWSSDEIRPFDLNRSGDLQYVEITLMLATKREAAGIVQMDSILADRYTKRYDSNRDGKLQLSELENNTFSDQIDTYDRNSDDELSPRRIDSRIGVRTQVSRRAWNQRL